MHENIIFVFPGQGAQYKGMAYDLVRDFSAARYVFDAVSDSAGRDIAKICFCGSGDILNKTENASVGTFAHSVAIAKIIEDEFKMPLYKMSFAMAGHSMGQYSALCCADCISLGDAVKALQARSFFMSMAAENISGSMVCIAGIDLQQVQQGLIEANKFGYAEISNYNEQKQFIISGKNNALDYMLAFAKKNNAKIAKRLNVTIPAHSRLMAGAAVPMAKYLDKIKMDKPKTNLFSNHTAEFISDTDKIKECLVKQMTNGVRWFDIMQKFPQNKITYSYELGPGKTLTGMIHRANVNCKAIQTDDVQKVKRMLKYLEQIMSR